MPSSVHISNNLDEWKGAGYWPRHRIPLANVEGSILEFGVKYFDRIDEAKLGAAIETLCTSGGTLFIHGPRGTGKTQLAAYLSMAVAVLQGDAAYAITQEYWSWPELLAAEKLTFDHPNMASVIGNARITDMLTIDEVQEGSTTDFARQSLTRLIDYRYGHMHRTILIANLQAEAIDGNVGTSVYSRLCETGAFMEIDNKPYR